MLKAVTISPPKLLLAATSIFLICCEAIKNNTEYKIVQEVRDYAMSRCTEKNTINLDSMTIAERSSLFSEQYYANNFFCTKDIFGNVKFFGIREASLAKYVQIVYMYRLFATPMPSIWQEAYAQLWSGGTCTMLDVSEVTQRYQILASKLRAVGAYYEAAKLLEHLDAIICNKQTVIRADGRDQLASAQRICLDEVYPVIHMSFIVYALERAQNSGRDLNILTSRILDQNSRTLNERYESENFSPLRNRSTVREIQLCHPLCKALVSESRMVTSYMYETCCTMCNSRCGLSSSAKTLLDSSAISSVSKTSDMIAVVALKV